MANVPTGGVKLKKAFIKNLLTNEEVECMFNPHEYTLTKRNTYTERQSHRNDQNRANFAQGGPQTLKLNLHFDTLTTNSDVREHTDKLWKMMQVDTAVLTETNKSAPPNVAFQWGTFYFEAVITNMTQKFTLFTHNGVPVRCVVDVTLEQKVDVDDYKDDPFPDIVRKEPTEEVVATEGDRIDNIVASVANKSLNDIREIMEDNNIDNPLNITPGSFFNL